MTNGGHQVLILSFAKQQYTVLAQSERQPDFCSRGRSKEHDLVANCGLTGGVHRSRSDRSNALLLVRPVPDRFSLVYRKHTFSQLLSEALTASASHGSKSTNRPVSQAGLGSFSTVLFSRSSLALARPRFLLLKCGGSCEFSAL